MEVSTIAEFVLPFCNDLYWLMNILNYDYRVLLGFYELDDPDERISLVSLEILNKESL